MRTYFPILNGFFAALLLLPLLLLSGCGGFSNSINVPQIDPTGERIFVPGGTSTVAPEFVIDDCYPEPAFASPNLPPMCPPDQLGVPVRTQSACLQLDTIGTGCKQVAGTLQVTPERMIAPINGEVVLKAGLCGDDGAYITREKIEWILSEESVGHFVEIGEQDSTFLQLVNTAPKKVNPSFARGRTAPNAMTVTRGTADPSDDVKVKSGESWISLTASAEGVSNVTVLAPESDNWNRRRTTAQVYWIDAQWQFPGPQIIPSGQAAQLATSVARASDTSPIPGWKVTYEVINSAGQSIPLEAFTDSNGVAGVTLNPGGSGGSVQVKMQIIRPSLPGDPGSAPLVVGEGATSVTWSAPQLAATISGPPQVGLGQTATYLLQVTNSGSLVANDVVVSDVLPQQLKYRISTPAAGIFGDRLEWRLGNLQPGQTGSIELNCDTVANGEIEHRMEAVSAGVDPSNPIRVQAATRTRIFSSALQVQMTESTGRTQVEVGQRVQYNILITNTSNVPLTGVILRDKFGEGVRHAGGGVSPIEQILGRLEPGQTVTKAITFDVLYSGRHCHILEVFADGGHTAGVQSCLDAVMPTAPRIGKLELQIQFFNGNRRAVGETASAKMVLRNTGEGPVTNAELAFRTENSLTPAEASQGALQRADEFYWNLGTIQPGGVVERYVNVVGKQVDPQAIIRAAARGDGPVQVAADAALEVVAPGAGTQPGSPSGGGAPPAGTVPGAGGGVPPAGAAPGPSAGGQPGAQATSLRLTPQLDQNAIRIGQEATVFLTIDNVGNEPNRSVEVNVVLPEGVDFVGVQGAVGGTFQANNQGGNHGVVLLNPIAEIPAGALPASRRNVQVRVRARTPGQKLITVIGVSQQSQRVQSQVTLAVSN